MTNRRFDALFGGKPRNPSERLEQRHMDLAASVQQVTEEIMLRLTRNLTREGRSENLCLAGGVALNCVANGKILRERNFANMWVQPAAGDAGGAVGAALAAYYQFAGRQRQAPASDAMAGGYLGPSFTQGEIEQRLATASAVFSTLDDSALIQYTVKALTAENVVGWFQGRMEFGPRALGARSILGDPRSSTMQSSLNLRVKFRESFRPFAPAVLRERVADWFDLDGDSPYMQIVAGVQERRRRPANPGGDRLFGIERSIFPGRKFRP